MHDLEDEIYRGGHLGLYGLVSMLLIFAALANTEMWIPRIAATLALGGAAFQVGRIGTRLEKGKPLLLAGLNIVAAVLVWVNTDIPSHVARIACVGVCLLLMFNLVAIDRFLGQAARGGEA